MIGATLGQLVITRQIGEGGMGAVYLAEHRVLKTKHVVKVLLPQWTQNTMIVQRFVNEARAAAAIRHRNIIQVQDCAQLPDGQWYIVMEYLDGGTLAQFASSHPGPLSPHLVLQVMSQVANGLGAAHARDIIHRDLKPENIFLTSREGNPHHVTILDFGIAKLGEAEGGASTRTGQMAGTPAYMAPEQMRDLKSVDPRTDVYALGVITYQLATGGWLPYQDGGTPRTYYELSAAEIYHRQLTQPPIDPRQRVSTVSEAWANAIMAALHPDPARRPQSARQFAIMLAEATPGDNFAPSGVELVRMFARELFDIGNMLETVRAPARKEASSHAASRYQIGQRLGLGGMAEVFRGTMVGAEGFAREVAIKRVLPGFSTVPQFATMFVEEARIASQLVHPNIVQVLDFDRDAEGRHFLVMEFVEGRDLDALRDTGPLPPSMINFVVTEALRGLGYAHNLPVPKQGMRGLVHRDVSPHNVLLSWEGAVKVSDFGIAKAREATAATASTMIKGKTGYMSPEQANGEQLDGRSDLFAVGVIMWELLTGQSLFVGTTQEAIAQIFFRPIPKPSTLRPGVPPDLEAVTMRLLERDRNARYATAEQAIADLSNCRDLPRDGRGELVRLLAERFPGAITERTSGRIPEDGSLPASSASKATALARPIPANAPSGGAGWSPQPTTLGSAAAQSVARDARSRVPYVIAAVVVAAAATVSVVYVQMKSSSESAPNNAVVNDQAPSTVPPVRSVDAATVLQVTVQTVPDGAQIVVDGTARGQAPVALTVERGMQLKIIATKDGFVDTTLNTTAERDGQILSLTLAPLPALAASSGSNDLPKPAAKPSTKRRPTKPNTSGSNEQKPGFDPNEVGGD
jgi:serine/threonine protein kinase